MCHRPFNVTSNAVDWPRFGTGHLTGHVKQLQSKESWNLEMGKNENESLNSANDEFDLFRLHCQKYTWISDEDIFELAQCYSFSIMPFPHLSQLTMFICETAFGAWAWEYFHKNAWSVKQLILPKILWMIIRNEIGVQFRCGYRRNIIAIRCVWTIFAGKPRENRE